MAQKNANVLLQGKRIRFVHPHPDDSISDSQLYGHDADKALLTVGEEGRNPENRLAEEKAAAAILGFKDVRLYPGRDGHVTEDIDALAQMVAEDAVDDKVDVLVSTLFVDHPDHIAATQVTIEAAKRAAKIGHAVGVLLVHHDSGGEYTTEAAPGTMERAFAAARQHRSQWRFQDGIHEDWPIVPGGFSMHPDDLDSLQPYPLMRDASYTYYSPAEIMLANVAEAIQVSTR